MEDKMRKLIFSAVFVLMFSTLSYGQGQLITNPDLDFVNSASKTSDFSYLPRGEEVYQLALDLYGDSKPTIFLTFKKWGSRTGNVWIAYTPVEGGYNRVQDAPGSAGFVFRPNGFYAIDPKGGLFVLISGRDGGDLVHYDIKNGVATTQKVQTIDYEKSEDKKYAEKILGHKLEDRSSDDHPSYKVLLVSAIEAESK